MINKTKIDGVEITLDDGDSNTSNITYNGDGYEKENDRERIEWMKKQLRYYGYRFINKNGVEEE